MQIKTDTYLEFESDLQTHFAKKTDDGLKFSKNDSWDGEEDILTITTADIPEFVRGLKVLYPEAFTDAQPKKRTRRG